MTPAELAGAAGGLSERYVREWLEQQASTAILEVEDARADAGARRYALPAGHVEALTDDASLNCIAPIGQLVVACAKPLDAVLEAYRTGDGIPYADYGHDLHEGQARFTAPMFDALLTSDWLGAVPEVHERLLADPPARVADVACGQGRSTLAIARGYPKVRVDGIDMDAASIEAAHGHLAASGLGDRVAFHLRDAADEELAGRYDLVYIHEALHDMSYPVRVLEACRSLLADGGFGHRRRRARARTSSTRPATRSSASTTASASSTACPSAWSARARRAPGTVMRADTVRRYALEAGFGGFEVLAIENDFYRFYRLVP